VPIDLILRQEKNQGSPGCPLGHHFPISAALIRSSVRREAEEEEEEAPRKKEKEKKEIATIFSRQSNSTGAQYATLQLDEESQDMPVELSKMVSTPEFSHSFVRLVKGTTKRNTC
jgi:hypothetical protein